jgi:hypothetical protein
VSNNIDILREKLMKEMARRKEAEKATPEVRVPANSLLETGHTSLLR